MSDSDEFESRTLARATARLALDADLQRLYDLMQSDTQRLLVVADQIKRLRHLLEQVATDAQGVANTMESYLLKDKENDGTYI